MDATPIHSREDLLAVVRRRQDELSVACLVVDEIAGLATGHFSKLTCGAKSFGLMSLFSVLTALGLRIRIEEDPEAAARYGRRWQPREERYVRRESHWRRNVPAG